MVNVYCDMDSCKHNNKKGQCIAQGITIENQGNSFSCNTMEEEW